MVMEGKENDKKVREVACREWSTGKERKVKGEGCRILRELRMSEERRDERKERDVEGMLDKGGKRTQGVYNGRRIGRRTGSQRMEGIEGREGER